MRGHSTQYHQTRYDNVADVLLNIRVVKKRIFACALLGIAGVGLAASAVNRQDDEKALATLDTDYQKAVERDDTKTMARILDDDFILVLGDGSVYTKNDLLKDAASGNTKYEHQVDSDRAVRVWGDTAVVTAKLWVKGLEDGKQVDYYQWFSDTYVRKPTGWSYVFGQASLALPQNSK